jgi:hypothetical protein
MVVQLVRPSRSSSSSIVRVVPDVPQAPKIIRKDKGYSCYLDCKYREREERMRKKIEEADLTSLKSRQGLRKC